MIDKEPGFTSWIGTAFSAAQIWITGHPYASWGGSTAFLAALWSSLKDGKGWCSSLFAAVLAIVITLSVLAVMHKTGLHEEWMPLVGMIVGFVGADRIRSAVLGAWDARKGKLIDNEGHEHEQ